MWISVRILSWNQVRFETVVFFSLFVSCTWRPSFLRVARKSNDKTSWIHSFGGALRKMQKRKIYREEHLRHRREYKSRNFFLLLTVHLSSYYNLSAQYSFESFLLFILPTNLVTRPRPRLFSSQQNAPPRCTGYNGLPVLPCTSRKRARRNCYRIYNSTS